MSFFQLFTSRKGKNSNQNENLKVENKLTNVQIDIYGCTAEESLQALEFGE